MPPKESKVTTRKRSEDAALIGVQLRIVVVRPRGAALERFVDIARNKPEWFFDYAKSELCDNTELAYLEADDGTRVPIQEPLWRAIRAVQPEALRTLIRILGEVVVS